MSIGSHHSPRSNTDSWITPRWVVDALGLLDLDPCESTPQPWPTAKRSYAIGRGEDGLRLPFRGTVFCNPPYSEPTAWAKRLAEHGNGILLTFARVETAWWQDWVWPFADAVWFPRGRLTFCYPDGTPARGNSGGPSAFAAYGEKCRLMIMMLQHRFGGAIMLDFVDDRKGNGGLFDTQTTGAIT